MTSIARLGRTADAPVRFRRELAQRADRLWRLAQATRPLELPGLDRALFGGDLLDLLSRRLRDRLATAEPDAPAAPEPGGASAPDDVPLLHQRESVIAATDHGDGSGTVGLGRDGWPPAEGRATPLGRDPAPEVDAPREARGRPWSTPLHVTAATPPARTLDPPQPVPPSARPDHREPHLAASAGVSRRAPETALTTRLRAYLASAAEPPRRESGSARSATAGALAPSGPGIGGATPPQPSTARAAGSSPAHPAEETANGRPLAAGVESAATSRRRSWEPLPGAAAPTPSQPRVATAAAQVADDDLAERLAEILREEARRHGVPLA